MPSDEKERCFARRRPHPSLFYARLSAARTTPLGGMNNAEESVKPAHSRAGKERSLPVAVGTYWLTRFSWPTAKGRLL